MQMAKEKFRAAVTKYRDEPEMKEVIKGDLSFEFD